MKRLSVILITAALIAGLVGCPAGPRYSLTISSTAGGSVTTPGEGTFTYAQGTAASLAATPDVGFRFVEWTGDVGTIADVTSHTTTIAMNGDYSIIAGFVAARHLIVTSTAGGVVAAPGEGTFVYDLGAVVNLVAAADTGYRFVSWTGNVDTIADVNRATTTMNMIGNYSITANFELRPTGSFLDEVLITQEPSSATAVGQLKDDTLDVFAWWHVLGLADASLHAEVLADPKLTSLENLSSYYELTFNPVGPVFPSTGKLNPFAAPGFREAVHWLVDREYVVREIMGGRAVPRYTCLNTHFADAGERYPGLIAAIEARYAHNPSKAASIIATEMEMLGAVYEDDRWMYDEAPVEFIFLIRTEDERKEIGDYLADLFEGLGFAVTRQYGHADDLGSLWRLTDPGEGVFHMYTGAWVSSMISRDECWSFAAFYTSLGAGWWGPLWHTYVNAPVFYDAAMRLFNYEFTNLEERSQLYETCLEYSMRENQRMFLFSRKWFSPMRANVRLANDLSGGVHGSWMWALTAHFVDDAGNPIVGGTMRVAIPSLSSDPWNPIGGTNRVYDTFAVRGTGDMGHWPDTRTGLRWPGRIEKAEVFVETGHAVGVTNTDWCSLTFVPEIQVPLDAWADWDAVNQRFLTVEDWFGSEGTAARSRSVSYYPKDIFEIPLHDGSTLSMGDFILYTIMHFDRAKPDSAIYDGTAVAEYDSLMRHFRGVKFITDNPDYGLIVEYYSDQWQLDAELMVNTMFPAYSQGPVVWHTIAVGIRAEEDKALAFSGGKAGSLGVPWMSFIDGPSLPILEGYLERAKATNYIPYEPTMGLYVTAAEAAERWADLQNWYAEKGHLWVGSGPFYLESADTTEKVIHLKRFEDYPDASDRWLFLLEPLP